MAIENKCKKCGGSMEFEPSNSNLICRKCGATEDFEKSEVFSYHSFDMNADIVEPEFKPEINGSHCSNCGAVFGADTNALAEACSYCGAHLTRDFSLN